MSTNLTTLSRTRSLPRQGGAGLARLGVAVAVGGVMLAMVSLINSLIAGSEVAAGNDAAVPAMLAWGFGVATAAFATAKLGVAVVLWGIVGRVRARVEAMSEALPRLVTPSREDAAASSGVIRTPFGAATVSSEAPPELLVHRASRLLWAPMVAMGVMAVYAGLVLSVLQSGSMASDAIAGRALGAWVQGVQFLGEGLLLGGISFLLGTILASLRGGGAEVQARLGQAVHTLRMPLTAKLFIGLMALGMMVEMAQFGLYAYAATLAADPSFATLSAWLGPLREFGLGLLLSGIVLALATIARVLGFQFHRVTGLIGRAPHSNEVKS